MATNTTNYGWTKPSYEDTADIEVINGAIDNIDAQVRTNEININFNTNNGVKNIIKNVAHSQGMFTVNDDGTITANGANTSSSAKFVVISEVSPTEAYKLNGMILNGCPLGGTAGGYRINLQLNGGNYINYAVDHGEGAVISGIPQNPDYNLRLIAAVEAGKTVNNILFKPMISTIGGEYQPYALSNAELTAAIQALQAQLANR